MIDAASRTILALVNGVAQETCPVNDRGLMYGDGVFRTVRMVASQPIWIDAHLDKLEQDCLRLGITCPARSAWEADLALAAALSPDATLKLLVTRGVGQRGYKPDSNAEPTRVVMLSPSATYPAAWAEEGIRVRLCDMRMGLQPRLAGVKHLNRLENVLARMEWSDPGIAEGVLRDSDEYVISGVSSNVFILRGDMLITPRLHRCGVAGVARQRIMIVAERAGLKAVEADLRMQDVLESDALMFSNSLIKLWWANRLDEREWPVCPDAYYKLRALLDD